MVRELLELEPSWFLPSYLRREDYIILTSGNGRASRTPQISLAEAAQLELSLFSLKTRYSGSVGNQCMQIYYCLDQQNQHVLTTQLCQSWHCHFLPRYSRQTMQTLSCTQNTRILQLLWTLCSQKVTLSYNINALHYLGKGISLNQPRWRNLPNLHIFSPHISC